KRRDYAAIAVAERIQQYDLNQDAFGPLKRTGKREWLNVLTIRRLPHCPYTETNRILAKVVRSLPDRNGAPVRCIIDQTGVGDVAREYLLANEKINAIGISMTGGDNSNSRAWNDHTVPKTHLVESLAFAAESGRLRIAADCEHRIQL